MNGDLRNEDRAARRLAVREFVRPVALEAGAGTGKTRALVARLATWLLGPGWDAARSELVELRTAAGRTPAEPERDEIAARVAEGVVAITFTEAAAAEMAGRLGRLLAALAGGAAAADLEPLPELLAGLDLAERARPLATVLSRVRVQTIHAFCHALLAEHPFEARLHPALEVDADGSALAAAVRETLVAHLRAADPALVALIAAGVDPAEVQEALVTLLSEGARGSDLAAERFDETTSMAILVDFATPAGDLAPFLTDLASRVRGSTTGQAADALSRALELAAGEGAARLRLAALATELAESTEEWNTAFARWRRDAPNKGEQGALGDRATWFLDLARRVGERLEAVSALDPERFETARTALAPLVDEVRSRLRRAGRLTFGDLLEEAASLLRTNGGVRRRVQRSVRQLLVDEFQDTDRRQCDLLRALAFEAEPAARPGLFVVGDPKQSIYSFRSADLTAYERFLSRIEAAGGVVGRLAMNFRSAPPILDEVARAVAPVMHHEPGVQPAFEPLVAGPELEKSPGYTDAGRAAVEYWLSWDDEAIRSGDEPKSDRAAAIEAAAIAADIAALRRDEGARWSGFAILLRARGQLETYLEALRRAGIPYAVQKDRSYYRRREVIDCISLVRWVLDPADRLAMVAALRSPFVGIPDAAWPPLWRHGFPAAVEALRAPDGDALAALEESIARAASETPDDLPGLAPLAGWPAALGRALRSLALARQEWSTLPVAAWLERLRSRFLLEPIAAARFLGRFGVANLERLFRELEEALTEGPEPLAALAPIRRAVEEDTDAEEARPPEAGEDAVAVLTIHTAKGLEFDQVYLPQIHRRPRADGVTGSAAFLPAERSPSDLAECILFGAPSPGWSDAWQVVRRAQAAEASRLLYVALTRARMRLVVCGRWPRKAEGSAAGADHRERAAPFLELLASRRPDDLETLFEGGKSLVHGGTAWRIAPGEAASLAAAANPRNESGRSAARPATVVPAAARSRARRRQSRPLFASVSAQAADEFRQNGPSPLSERSAPRARAAAGRRDLALARGIAIHRALELAPLERESPDEWRARVLATFDEALGSGAGDERSAFPAALARLAGSQLGRRLGEHEPGVLARALPLLHAAEPGATDGPVAGSLGTLDLLYRDEAGGETVIADFKSDPLPADGRDEAIAALVARYRPQLELYGRAVASALALDRPPRLELWLLGADRVVPLPPGTPERSDVPDLR
ncbi:MAG: UvrD-helicase domain-containing protein [Thermoanaerobaculia bacterium]